MPDPTPKKQTLQEIIKSEYSKCAASPVYFMKHYVKISHPIRGVIAFNLYPFQEKTLQSFYDNKFNIILKSRQMGISTLTAAFSLWTMIFNKDKNIIIISTKQEVSKELVSKVRFANDNLPTWLKIKCVEDNRLSLKLANGSQIRATSSSSDAGRSMAVSLLVIDEAGFVDDIEKIWTSAWSTLSCLDKNELILTKNGLLRLDALINKDTHLGFNDINIEVDTGGELSPASHFYMSDKSDLYRVNFESGGSILATEEHPLMTKNGWKTIKTLIPDKDFVLSKYNQNLFGNKVDYTQFNPDIRIDDIKYKLSHRDISYLCGLWIAEGHFVQNGIGITNTDISMTNWLKQLGFKCYDGRHYYFYSVWINKLFKWIGCEGTAHTKKVPHRILSASKEEQKYFLQGLFDGDGCTLKEKGLKLTSVSHELLSNVRCMLLNFGIYSYIRKVIWKSTKSTVIKDKTRIFDGYELFIGGWDAHKFYNEIGFNLPRKQLGQKDLSLKSIKRIYPGKQVIRNLILESKISQKNFYKKYKVDLSRYLHTNSKGLGINSAEILLSVSDKNSSNYKLLYDQYIKDTTQYYDKVVSIDFIKNDFSYDLKVPSKECFISNGYLNHNTGGNSIILSCVTGDTYIFTDHGIKQIQDFVPNNRVVGDYDIGNYNILGYNNIRSGNLFKNNGVVDTIKINTKYGKIEGSKTHKLWAFKYNQNKFGWFTLEELSSDDYVSIQYGMNIWGNNDNIDNFIPSYSSKIKSPINFTKISKELAYLFGLYIAEGSAYKMIGKNNQLVGGNITITCGDKDITWIFDYLDIKYYTSDYMHYNMSSKNLIELFECVGFDLSNKAHNKSIPPRLLEMSKENILYLLRGIFDGDGCSSGGDISLTSTSIKLIEQVRILLNNVGILSSLVYYSKEQMNSYKSVKIKFNNDIHRIEISGRNSLKYFNLIGFSIKRKQDNIKFLLSKKLKRATTYDIVPGSIDLVNLLYDNSGETTYSMKNKYGLFLNGIVNKSTEYKTKNISRDIVIEMYNRYKNTLSIEHIEYFNKIIADNLYWVKIDEITYDKKETYDFSLPENTSDFWCHSIIYNGFLGHQTPNGKGNWFHQMWSKAEIQENNFNPIKLQWSLHPERDQIWRDLQDKELGPKNAAQECDAEFLSSGHSVIELETIEFYKKTVQKEPVETRGLDRALWIWQYPDYTQTYIIGADPARGDSSDFAAAHVLNAITLEQCAEYKGKLNPKDFGNLLVALGSEYNNALLVPERDGYGWGTVQQIIDRDYPNLFYMTADLKYVDPETQLSNKYDIETKKAVPGFTTNLKTRPIIIANLEQYFREKTIQIYSKRTLAELETFVWKNLKAQAIEGFNDDLCMSLGIALWIRDTALRLRQEGIDLTKSALGHINRNKIDQTPFFKARQSQVSQKAWQMSTGRKGYGKQNTEDLTWLL